jgi:hypothetical protein
MEYLDVETLADRIARAGAPEGAPLRLDDALQIACRLRALSTLRTAPVSCIAI